MMGEWHSVWGSTRIGVLYDVWGTGHGAWAYGVMGIHIVWGGAWTEEHYRGSHGIGSHTAWGRLHILGRGHSVVRVRCKVTQH